MVCEGFKESEREIEETTAHEKRERVNESGQCSFQG